MSNVVPLHPAPDMAWDDLVTIPLSLDGEQWSLLLVALRRSETLLVRTLGDEVARQITATLED